jgi:hypothetical protein
MVKRAAADCQHLDNYRRCRVHKAPWLVRWLLPKGRPLCVFELDEQDPVICNEQLPHPRPRPPGPAPMPRKH